MATVNDMIRCPKCGKRMMGVAYPQKFGKEYFAHCCHQYFGLQELVKHWGYDAGDLFDPSLWYVEPDITLYDTTDYRYEKYMSGEPFWYNILERDDAYQMVTRMFLGIPELDDLADLMDTQNDALQIGVR